MRQYKVNFCSSSSTCEVVVVFHTLHNFKQSVYDLVNMLLCTIASRIKSIRVAFRGEGGRRYKCYIYIRMPQNFDPIDRAIND